MPGFVCNFVCEQDNSKTYGRILMKFSGYVLPCRRSALCECSWYNNIMDSKTKPVFRVEQSPLFAGSAILYRGHKVLTLRLYF